MGAVGDEDGTQGALRTQTCQGYRGHLGGGKPPPPMLILLWYSGTVRRIEEEHGEGLPGLRQNARIGNVLQVPGADHDGIG